MRPRTLLLLTVLALISASCGGPSSGARAQRPLHRQQVAAVFARAGVPLEYMGRSPGTEVDDYAYFPARARSGGFNTLEVEVIPAVKPPGEAVRTAGYHEDGQGHIVRPLAVVANVIVTVYPSASHVLKLKTRKAVAALGRLAPN